MAYLIAVLAGILNMLQSGSNATLNEKLGVGPAVPALIVYAGGILSVLMLWPWLGKPLAPLAANAAGVPWWAWIGGLLGAVYVLTTLTVAKGMGAGAFTAVTLTAAIVTSLLLDRYGLMGFEQRPLTLLRGIGGALMVGGVLLVARF